MKRTAISAATPIAVLTQPRSRPMAKASRTVPSIAYVFIELALALALVAMMTVLMRGCVL